ELRLGGLVTGITIGMVLTGELAVGALDLVVAGAFFHAQSFVVVARHGSFRLRTADRSGTECILYALLNESPRSRIRQNAGSNRPTVEPAFWRMRLRVHSTARHGSARYVIPNQFRSTTRANFAP